MSKRFGSLQKSLRSNRTFMELKLNLQFLIIFGSEGSNRTFMELKLIKSVTMYSVVCVLIVPLWN